MRGVTATRTLTGDDLRLEDVWAVAVDGGHAEVLGDDARLRMSAARDVLERAAQGQSEQT
jgi:hypothetical protein